MWYAYKYTVTTFAQISISKMLSFKMHGRHKPNKGFLRNEQAPEHWVKQRQSFSGIISSSLLLSARSSTRLESKRWRKGSQGCASEQWVPGSTLQQAFKGLLLCMYTVIGGRLDQASEHGSLLPGPLLFSEPAVFFVVVDVLVVPWSVVRLLRRSSASHCHSYSLSLPGFYSPCKLTRHKNESPQCSGLLPKCSWGIKSSLDFLPSSAHEHYDSYWRVESKPGHCKRVLTGAILHAAHWPKAECSVVKGPDSYQLQQPP